MLQKSVFCLATSRTQAGQIVDQLRAASFSNNDISTLLAEHRMFHGSASVKHAKAFEGAVAGAGGGGVIGGALDLVACIGALIIPGFASFISAGPLLAALSGVAIGAVVGCVTGGLIGMGIPESEAEHHEAELQDGNILISVHTENAEEITQAEVIFARAHAQDICTAGETAVTDDNRATEIITYPTGHVQKGPAQ